MMNIETFNRSLLMLSRQSRKLARELHAKVTGNAYYCNALKGESEYNICVNSDMSVSCNCRDYDGTGRIGDLRTQTMADIFKSEPAVSFRQILSRGKLPLLTCASCPELHSTTREQAKLYATVCKVPHRGLMVENTVRCCYNCSGCYRLMVMRNRKRNDMTQKDIERVADELASNNVQHLMFFNLGDPFCSDDIYQQIETIRSKNPDIRITISTNGMLLDSDEKRRAALLVDNIVVSIDGPDNASVNKYQRGADFERVYTNVQKLVDYRSASGSSKTVIEWKYVVFNWNDRREQIEKAIHLAQSAEMDSISFCPTRTPIYGFSWRYHIDPFFKRLGTKSWKGREVLLGRETDNKE